MPPTGRCTKHAVQGHILSVLSVMPKCAIIRLINDRKRKIRMLNEERIRLMTKMASYETREGKEHMPIKQYYRRDYISYEMMKTFVTSTIAFGILFLCWVIYKMDSLADFLTGKELPDVAVSILIKYAVFICIYQVIAYFVYSRRYKRATASMRKYYATLKKVERLQEKEERLQPSEEWK